jgi:hypothetical protein
VGIEFAFYPVKFLGVGWRVALYRDVWPFGGVFSVDLQPLVEARLSIRFNGVGGAFGLANTAVNAFIRMDHQHVFALVKAIHGADFNTVHKFAFDAVFGDDIGHGGPLLELMAEEIAEAGHLCTHFFCNSSRIEFLVEQLCSRRRAALFSFGQNLYDPHIIMDGKRKNVVWLYGMAGFCNFGAVDADVPAFDQFRGKAAMLHKPCVDQPFINPLCQFYPCFICARRAASAAKGELGSIGFSGRGGRGGGRTGSGARFGLYLSRRLNFGLASAPSAGGSRF